MKQPSIRFIVYFYMASGDRVAAERARLASEWAKLAALRERDCPRGPYKDARDNLINAARDSAGDTIERAIAANLEAYPDSEFIIRINVIHNVTFVCGGKGELEKMEISSSNVFETEAGPDDEALCAHYKAHEQNAAHVGSYIGYVIVAMACRCGTRKSPASIRNTRIYAIPREQPVEQAGSA